MDKNTLQKYKQLCSLQGHSISLILWQSENDQFVCLMDNGVQFTIAEDALVNEASLVPFQKAMETEGHHAEQILRLKGFLCDKAYQRGIACAKAGANAASTEFSSDEEAKAYKQGMADGLKIKLKYKPEPTTADKLAPSEEGALNECLESAKLERDACGDNNVIRAPSDQCWEERVRRSAGVVVPTISEPSPVPEWGDLKVPVTGSAVITELFPEPPVPSPAIPTGADVPTPALPADLVVPADQAAPAAAGDPNAGGTPSVAEAPPAAGTDGQQTP
jgi:hypothetical protein